MKISELRRKFSNGIKFRTMVFGEAKDVLNELNALQALLNEDKEKNALRK